MLDSIKPFSFDSFVADGKMSFVVIFVINSWQIKHTAFETTPTKFSLQHDSPPPPPHTHTFAFCLHYWVKQLYNSGL